MYALFLLLSLARADEACPPLAAISELEHEIHAAEFAFQDMDEQGFRAALERARRQAACLSEPLPAALAAALHRQEACHAWLMGQREVAISAFAEAISLAPDYVLPVDLAPVGNPLRDLYAEAQARPSGRPAPMPVPLALQVADTEPAPELPDPATAPRRRPVRLGIAAGGAGLGAVALYGLSLAGARAFERPDGLPDDIDVLSAARRVNHLEVGAAAGLGALALGLGTAAVLQIEW